MLLGICLVVSGDFGNRLVFRHPQSQQQQQHRQPQLQDKKTSSSAASASGSLSVSASLSATVPSRLPDVGGEDDDDVPPVQLLASAADSRGGSQRRSSASSTNSSGAAAAAAAVVSIPAAPAAAVQPSAAAPFSSLLSSSPSSSAPAAASPPVLPLSDAEDVWGLPVYELCRLFSPLSSHLSSSLLDVCVNSVRFLSFPLRLPADSSHELTRFNVVLVLRADSEIVARQQPASASPDPAAASTAAHLQALYAAILVSLSRLLEHEQRRCGFLSFQCSLMAALRDRHVNALLERDRRHWTAGEQQQPQPQPQQADGQDALGSSLSALLVRHSLLAAHLHSLYSALLRLERRLYVQDSSTAKDDQRAAQGRARQRRERRQQERLQQEAGREEAQEEEEGATHVQLLINDWLHLHCTLSPSASPSPLLSLPSASAGTAASLSIRPYQTLLLTTSQSSLLRSLPVDSSPLLARLVLHINPIHSFLSLSQRLSLPLSSLLLLAHHLVHWGKARVIDALQDTDAFVCSPPPPPLSAQLIAAFAALFPASSLPLFLASFHPPRCLSQSLSRLSAQGKQQYMRQLVWCMEQQIVAHRRTFIYWLRHVEGGGRSGRDERTAALQSDAGDRRSWSDAQWLRQLRQYGSGSVSLTEAAWRERQHCTRRELQAFMQRHPAHFLLVHRT